MKTFFTTLMGGFSETPSYTILSRPPSETSPSEPPGMDLSRRGSLYGTGRASELLDAPGELSGSCAASFAATSPPRPTGKSVVLTSSRTGNTYTPLLSSICVVLPL